VLIPSGRQHHQTPPEKENPGGGPQSHQYSGLRPIDNDSFSEENDDDNQEDNESSLEYAAI
jgi:hypothetical protein